tara:strand:+ start:638 stop:1576 length:939 start_codon:yes stop_codon:yes gene_type:complete
MALNKLKSKNEKDLKWPKILIAILSTIGIVDTGSITLKNWGLFNSLSCPGINNGCETVLNSPWGNLYTNNQINIPLSTAGFVSYGSILLITLILTLNTFSNKQKVKRLIWWVLYLISCGASVFSILLVNIMFFKIEAFCIFCILSAILSFSIFILTIIGARFESRETMFYRGLIITFVVLLSGLIWSNKVDPTNANLNLDSSEKISPVIRTKSSMKKIKFARFLNENGIVMYSAYWCPHCHDQKELFGQEAVEELTIIECAKDGKNNKFELCQQKEIEGFPSWEIDNQIYSGTRELSELGELTNYPLLEDLK